MNTCLLVFGGGGGDCFFYLFSKNGGKKKTTFLYSEKIHPQRLQILHFLTRIKKLYLLSDVTEKIH